MRLQGLDIARFAAFVGMVLVNFRIAAEVVPLDDTPSALTNLLEGRAAALFVVLAGVGFALGRSAWHLTLRRAIFLFLIGMANMVIFDADILHFYALYFIVAIFFVAASPKRLFLGVAAILAVSFAAQVLLNYDQGWNWSTYEYADFWTLGGFLRHSFYNGWHPVFPWVAFMLIGMWIGRMRLSSLSTQLALAGGGLLATVGVALLSRSLSVDPELAEIMGLSPIPPGPLYILSGAATAASAIGVILLLTPVLTRLRLTNWLSAPGRMSLTLYVAHIYIGMGVMDELGLLNGSLDTTQIFVAATGFSIASIFFARLWFRLMRRGPLEALMRLTTEGRL